MNLITKSEFSSKFWGGFSQGMGFALGYFLIGGILLISLFAGYGAAVGGL